jgi:hypothetical protein
MQTLLIYFQVFAPFTAADKPQSAPYVNIAMFVMNPTNLAKR